MAAKYHIAKGLKEQRHILADGWEKRMPRKLQRSLTEDGKGPTPGRFGEQGI